MFPLYLVKSTPTFERGFRALTKRDRELLEQFVKLLDVLRLDPYNTNKQHDIKKLTDVAKGEGQWRIRIGHYRLRYDIFDNEVILHSVSHRKEAY
jgi:mRNA-degrading endonuclease RelE of RelBE toxin-antitoxin system